MIDLVILSDRKLLKSNKDIIGHGLITEVVKALSRSDAFDIKLISSFPSLLSRVYLPILYLPSIIFCFLLKFLHIFNSRKLLVLLYPSRLRVLSILFGKSSICLGPDDTSLVLAALARAEASKTTKYFRHIEKFISDAVEILTPNTVSLFVGSDDVQSYKQRHPKQTSIFLPHPLFECDLVNFSELKTAVCSNVSKVNQINLVIYGTIAFNSATFGQIKDFCNFAKYSIAPYCSMSFHIYGSANHWLSEALRLHLPQSHINCHRNFRDFLDIVGPYSCLISFAPYKHGTKTRVLSALSNAMPCFCLKSHIPCQLISLQYLDLHAIDFVNCGSSFDLSAFLCPETRLALASQIRSQDYPKQIVNIFKDLY